MKYLFANVRMVIVRTFANKFLWTNRDFSIYLHRDTTDEKNVTAGKHIFQVGNVPKIKVLFRCAGNQTLTNKKLLTSSWTMSKNTLTVKSLPEHKN